MKLTNEARIAAEGFKRIPFRQREWYTQSRGKRAHICLEPCKPAGGECKFLGKVV